MKRFIRYLYEYEKGKRRRNVGFVRVDQEEDTTTVQIHGKGLQDGNGVQELQVYLFFHSGKDCMGIYAGHTKASGTTLNYELRYTAEETGTAENYELIAGIVLKDEEDHWYAALWEEDMTDVCKMKLWEKEPEDKPEDEPEEKKAVCCEKKEVEEQQPAQEETGENISGEEVPRYVRKIQRKDLAMLPRCEWRLANNSFLVHGYYNYHHLILTIVNDSLKLGVPGVYYPQEAKVAESFGFPEFLSFTELGIELTEEEKGDPEKFGYWCRSVRGSVE